MEKKARMAARSKRNLADLVAVAGCGGPRFLLVLIRPILASPYRGYHSLFREPQTYHLEVETRRLVASEPGQRGKNELENH